MTGAPYFQVGYVARAHGLAGEVGVKTFDPASEALFDVEKVRLVLRDGEAVELSVDSIRAGTKELLVGFEGVEGRTAAERLVGAKVEVAREALRPPEEGEYFQGDLVGLEAVDEAGAPLGRVEEIWDTGPVPNLVIRAEGREELIIPFVDDFVPEVDVPKGRLVIRPPEFLE